MQCGNWETKRELGKGGQGVAYLAENSIIFYTILDTIKKAVQHLPGVHTTESYNLSARQLAESLRQYSLALEGTGIAALKVLHEPLRTNQKAIFRLTQEIEALNKNPHPHIIKILDSSPHQGWFATPFFSQGTLAENLTRFKTRPLIALEAFRPIVDAVVRLHLQNIIHRDIKPANIFFSNEGLVLGDFGLVFFADEARTRISDTYENVGSRDWMPPWAYGKRVEELTPAFDVFSLGKVLWAMISGKTQLPLWYHRRTGNDLTVMFPKDPHMHLLISQKYRRHSDA